MLLKADPCLENDVADDKADPSVCLQLNQISCNIFRNGWIYGTHIVLRKPVFFKKFLPQGLHCSGKQGRVASGR